VAAQIPPDIGSALRRIGAVIDPAATAALYAPLHRPGPEAGVKLTRDRRYGADPRHRLDTFAPGVAGAALLRQNIGAEGGDPQLQAERSALPGLLDTPVPVLLAYAEIDPPEFHEQSEQAHRALRAAGCDATLLKLAGHSHTSEVYAINTADHALTDAVLEFVQAHI